jgi:hypothetical protein
VAIGGDFAFEIRYGALEATAALDEAESHEHDHFPYARRLHLGWRQNADALWVSDKDDERRWEVISAECGDTDGPAENQTEQIRHLRGPYSSEHRAKQVAKKHFDEN